MNYYYQDLPFQVHAVYVTYIYGMQKTTKLCFMSFQYLAYLRD